ncbi:MAG: hypothetical protein WEG56_06580 [Chloroflexota bacterium]
MSRRLPSRAPDADPPEDRFDEGPADPAADGTETGGPVGSVAPDLAALPIAGITRRRMAGLVGGLLAAWIIIVFARQVGEASAATAKADDIAQGNAARQGQVAALERELDLIARQRYVEQQARGYGLGTAREVPFSLAVGAPGLPADAPGSAAVRLGADTDRSSPLESWLTVLFGPSD